MISGSVERNDYPYLSPLPKRARKGNRISSPLRGEGQGEGDIQKGMT